MLSAPKGAHKILVPSRPPRGSGYLNRNDDNKDIHGREIMTAEQNEPDNRSEQQPTPRPPLTGDLRLDNALESLRRTPEQRKKQPSDQPAEEPCATVKPDDSRGE